MNVLYILGNGFDKAQGMNTSYPEFYAYLQSISSPKDSRLLSILKQDIKSNIELWSDMEEALGKFTDKAQTLEEFVNFYFELSEHLQDYLKTEEAKFTPSIESKKKFQEDLLSMGEYLGEYDKRLYSRYYGTYPNNNKNISIITLNYTNTLEKLLDIREGKPVKQFNTFNYLENIIHLHGTLDDSIILGVDNIEQVSNIQFRDNPTFKDIMIKLQSNETMKFTRHLTCEDLIRKANYIILHGVSLGDTDSHWWKVIGQQISKRTDVCIIQHLFKPGIIKNTRKQLTGAVERDQRNLLLKKMEIVEENKIQSISERLFFTFNKPVFIL